MQNYKKMRTVNLNASCFKTLVAGFLSVQITNYSYIINGHICFKTIFTHYLKKQLTYVSIYQKVPTINQFFYIGYIKKFQICI